jgi:hypothetical protein
LGNTKCAKKKACSENHSNAKTSRPGLRFETKMLKLFLFEKMLGIF